MTSCRCTWVLTWMSRQLHVHTIQLRWPSLGSKQCSMCAFNCINSPLSLFSMPVLAFSACDPRAASRSSYINSPEPSLSSYHPPVRQARQQAGNLKPHCTIRSTPTCVPSCLLACLQFPLSDYQDSLAVLLSAHSSAPGTGVREAVVAELRRHSSGFARGLSRYRGVTKHHLHAGKWEARIGRVAGAKYLVS